MSREYRRRSWMTYLADLTFLVFLVFMAGCAGMQQPAPSGPGRAGTMQGALYHNDYFKFTWQPPAGYEPIPAQAPVKPVFYNGPVEMAVAAWREAASLSEAGLLLYGSSAELPPEQTLEQTAQALAGWQAWRYVGQHALTWEGVGVLDAFYEPREAAADGKARQVMVRLRRVGPDLLVYYLNAPAMDFEALRAKFLVLMEGVRLIRPEAPPAAPAEPAKPEDLAHTVQQGETPAMIAQWYTGKAENWRAILKHNGMQSASGLKVGQPLLIPGDLLIKRDPMPKPRPKPRVPAAAVEGERSAAPAPAPPEIDRGSGGDKGLLLEPTGPR